MRAFHLLFCLWLGAAVGAPVATPVIIAHRGASGYLPEHTLAAKAAAHAMGADYLEQDVVLSKDDVPIVLHDIHVDAVTDVAARFPERKRADGRYYALDFTVAELKQLRVSERFDPKTGAVVFPRRFPKDQGGFQIVTLEEELQFIQGLNRSTGRRTGIYPEIKAPAWHRREGRDISRIALEMLARYGYRTKTDAVILQCFDVAEAKRIRTELGYAGRLVVLLGNEVSAAQWQKPERLAELAEFADGIGPALAQVLEPPGAGTNRITELVSCAHALNLFVHPYTVRADDLPDGIATSEELHRLLFEVAKVDGVFTDFPDRSREFLQSAKLPAQSPVVRPLPRAHAHNDYEHARPLWDALAAGFCSVEADIWLVDGQLLVAHDLDHVTPARTLQALYLDPLRERVRQNGGGVFPGVPTVTLLIDVKSDAAATYPVLRDVLAEYRELLTEFTATTTNPRAVTVILSGQRAMESIAAEPVRWVALDGRLADLDAKQTPHLIPLISDNWKQFFAWRGVGEFSSEERVKLETLVKRAHEQGRRLRFWGCPDTPAMWQALDAAGVDLIGADALAGLADYFRAQLR